MKNTLILNEINSGRCRLAFIILLAALIALHSFSTKAAYSDNFGQLVVELQGRSLALSNSLNKIEKSQKKACDKAIKDLLKPADSLADDVKTASKVEKSLEGAFPAEFALVPFPKTVTFTNNISSLLAGAITGIQADLQAWLTNLDATVSALPASKDQLSAASFVADAQDALAIADAASDPALLFKALTAATKALTAGEKAAAKAASGGGGGGGGGSGGNTMSATVSLNGGINWVANTNITVEWVQSSGILDIGGESTTSLGGSQLNVAMCSGFNGSGNYNVSVDCGGFAVLSPFDFYSQKSGTLNVTTCDTSTHTFTATYSVTANDGTNSITINGSVNVKNLIVTP